MPSSRSAFPTLRRRVVFTQPADTDELSILLDRIMQPLHVGRG